MQNKNNNRPTNKQIKNKPKGQQRRLKTSTPKPRLGQTKKELERDIIRMDRDRQDEDERWHRREMDTRLERKKKLDEQLKQQEEEPWYENLGSTLGKYAARGAHGLFKTLTGFGDYDLESNSIVARATDGEVGSAIPHVVNLGEQRTFISHREFLGNVRGTTEDFSIRTYELNPGLDDTFPWAFAISNSFTSYEIKGMVFEYRSLSSEYTATPYMGYVAMGTQYNALDPTFTSKKVLLNSEYANSTKPSKNLLHPIECHRDQIPNDHLYVRSGDAPTGSDIRLYDLGKFSIATGGQSSSGVIGELWVSYEIELYTPKLASAVGSLVNADHWTGGNASAGLLALAGAVKAGGSKIGLTINPTTGLVTFPKSVSSGTYMIFIVWKGASQPNLEAPPVNVVANMLYKSNTFGSAPTAFSPPYGATNSIEIMSLARVTITGEAAQFNFNGGITGTFANMFWDLYVTQVPDTLDDPDDTSLVVNDEVANEIMHNQRMEFIKKMDERLLEKRLSTSNQILDIEEIKRLQQNLNKIII
jgi:hypothetical protein